MRDATDGCFLLELHLFGENETWAVATFVLDTRFGETIQASRLLVVGDEPRVAQQLTAVLLDDATSLAHFNLYLSKIESREVVLTRVVVDSSLKAEFCVELVKLVLQSFWNCPETFSGPRWRLDQWLVTKSDEWRPGNEGSWGNHGTATADGARKLASVSGCHHAALVLRSLWNTDHVEHTAESLEALEVVLGGPGFVVLFIYDLVQKRLNELVCGLLVSAHLYEGVDLALQNCG